MRHKPYASDLSDTEWALLAPLIPPPKTGGRPRSVEMRAVLNAIFYVVKTGCQWGMLPHDFPPKGTVYHYFNSWRKEGLWERINTRLREQARQAAGRAPTPSAAIIDSQSVKTAAKGGLRGFDGGKQIKGRKRHVLTDTLGLVLTVLVTEADMHDGAVGIRLILMIAGLFPRLRLIWADGSYRGKFAEWVQRVCHWTVEITLSNALAKGFQVLPRRSVGERTFGWLGLNRRLSKDYEYSPQTSEAMIYTAMIRLMLRRLARP